MKEKINLKWWDKSWNPMSGCTPVSEACENCYAKRIAHHYPDAFGGREKPFGIKLYRERLEQPLHWKRPRFIFVCDMGDLFHEDVEFGFIDGVLIIMALCKEHTFCLLSKRPKRMVEYFSGIKSATVAKLPLPNVWLGVTAENQQRADERIPVLLSIPAAKRFVSIEPMLGPIVFTKEQLKKLSWVICGGESGPHARPMDPNWARDLRDQCQAAGVPFWFKQNGEWLLAEKSNELPGKLEVINAQLYRRVGKHAAGRLLDGKEWLQRPEVTHGTSNQTK